MTKGKEHKLYGKLLKFLTVYLVDLSQHKNNVRLSREQFSSNIDGCIIEQSGMSNWDWMAELLAELNILEPTDSNYYKVCQNGDEIYNKFSKTPRPDIISLDFMLEAFVDLCGHYGPCIKLATRSTFQINDNYQSLFHTFSEFGYTQKKLSEYVWTNKMDSALLQNGI